MLIFLKVENKGKIKKKKQLERMMTKRKWLLLNNGIIHSFFFLNCLYFSVLSQGSHITWSRHKWSKKQKFWGLTGVWYWIQTGSPAPEGRPGPESLAHTCYQELWQRKPLFLGGLLPRNGAGLWAGCNCPEEGAARVLWFPSSFSLGSRTPVGETGCSSGPPPWSPTLFLLSPHVSDSHSGGRGALQQYVLPCLSRAAGTRRGRSW